MSKPQILKIDQQEKLASLKISKIEKTRNFLNKNKIFFETVTASTLTVMAIIVAVAQLVVTSEQTAYLEQQTIIGRSQALPHFVISAKQFMNEDNTFAVGDKILVYNQGNIAYNIIVQTAVFFEFSYLYKTQTQDLSIPVSGYYTVQLISGDATGLVLTIESPNNNSKRMKIQDDLRDLAKANDKSILLDVKRYIKLSYRDIFNELHTEYYYIPLIFGSTLMDKIEGESIFAGYNEKRGSMHDLDTMTAVDLYNLFP